MASREKARLFLEVSETHQHYSSTIDYALTFFIAKAEKEGNPRFAADLRKAKGEYHTDFAKAIEITEQVYAEVFSDEELDDLIILHSNPATKKLRTLGADIMNRVLEKYLDVAG